MFGPTLNVFLFMYALNPEGGSYDMHSVYMNCGYIFLV